MTGSFKDASIHEWLERHNPSQLLFEKAVDNFTSKRSEHLFRMIEFARRFSF